MTANFIVKCEECVNVYVHHTQSRALQSHDLSEREFAVDHIHTSLTTQGHGGLPQNSDWLNSGATFETTRTLKTIHIIHSHINSKKADMRRMIMKAK